MKNYQSRRIFSIIGATIFSFILITIPFNQSLGMPREIGDKPLDNQEIGINLVDYFIPNYVINESKGTYQLELKMDESGLFHANAKIEVENLSKDRWENIVFYFIPNVFTEENNERLGQSKLEDPALVNIEEININGTKANYSLDYDTLTIMLEDPLEQYDSKDIEVVYNFTVPENGVRFTKQADNYYLAQWYPMLATYRNGWNKRDYTPITESYHTDHSNFTLSFDIPKDYTLVSSSDEDISDNTGTIHAQNVKELFVSILKDQRIFSTTVDGVEVRLFGLENDENVFAKEIDAFSYYNRTFGQYPYKQLDVVLGGGVSMEYPGIVTSSRFERALVHEIAHQWFFATVSNDPYYNGWLDEGITEFAASLYKYSYMKDLQLAFNLNNNTRQMNNVPKEKSNLAFDEYQTILYPYIYTQPINQLWELFSDYGGVKTAEEFFEDYYKTYSFEEIDTKEFIRFTKAYFNLKNNKYFGDWLNL